MIKSIQLCRHTTTNNVSLRNIYSGLKVLAELTLYLLCSKSAFLLIMENGQHPHLYLLTMGQRQQPHSWILMMCLIYVLTKLMMVVCEYRNNFIKGLLM